MRFDGIDKKTAILIRIVAGINSERFCVVCINSDNTVRKCTELSNSVVNSVNVDVRQIVEFAFAGKTARIAVAHNHLTGDVEPSDEDIRLTRKIKTVPE